MREQRARLRVEIERRARAEEVVERLDTRVAGARADISARRRCLPRPLLVVADLVGHPALGSLAGAAVLGLRRARAKSEPDIALSHNAAAERNRRLAIERRMRERQRELAGLQWHERTLATASRFATAGCAMRKSFQSAS